MEKLTDRQRDIIAQAQEISEYAYMCPGTFSRDELNELVDLGYLRRVGPAYEATEKGMEFRWVTLS